MDRILLGYDGSQPSHHAGRQAADMAAKLGAEVTVLVVAEFTPGAYSVVAPGMVDPIPPMLDTDSYERLAHDSGEARLRRGVLQ